MNKCVDNRKEKRSFILFSIVLLMIRRVVRSTEDFKYTENLKVFPNTG